MKRFSLILAALAALLVLPAAHAVAVPAHAVAGVGALPSSQHVAPAPGNHVVKVADSDPDAQKWKWVPENFTIKVGDTVTWDMTGAQVAHTATADPGQPGGTWDSGYINPGAKWSNKFTTPGQIHYHCTPHPWKKGIITVTP
jgi:plastocyanin